MALNVSSLEMALAKLSESLLAVSFASSSFATDERVRASYVEASSGPLRVRTVAPEGQPRSSPFSALPP